jgi:hypothetical protein
MNGILIAILLTSAAPSFEATTLDGRTVVGPIEELTPQRLTIAAEKGRTSIPTAKLLTIAPKKKPGLAADVAGVVVELTDGTMIHASEYVARGNQARITLARDEIVEAPTNIVRAVLCGAIEGDSLRAEWARMTDMKTDADLLIVRNGDGLDYHKGVLHDVTADTIRFDLDGEVLAVKRSKVYGLVYRRTPTGELPPALCRITDATDSQWPARSFALAAKFEWTTPAGVTVSQALENIARIDFSSGKLLYLGDLKPDSAAWTPFFGGHEPLPAVKQYYAPRFNRGFNSHPLSLAHVEYAKGLAMYSRTEIVYRLPERFSRFQAVAGIADAVRPGGKARLVVRGDEKVLFEGGFSGSDDPRSLDLDVTGVRRLTILVDFEEGLNVGSQLLLCNARVVK